MHMDESTFQVHGMTEQVLREELTKDGSIDPEFPIMLVIKHG